MGEFRRRGTWGPGALGKDYTVGSSSSQGWRRSFSSAGVRVCRVPRSVPHGKGRGGLCNAGRDTEVQQGGGAHSESQGEGGSVEKSGTDLSGVE